MSGSSTGRTHAMIKPLVLLLGALALGACESAVVCTANVVPSIVAEVRDSLTSAPAATGATLLVRSAAGGEATAGTGEELYLFWGQEQAGRFNVTVQKPGYVDWHRSEVRVARNRCHVETARLLVRLRPAG